MAFDCEKFDALLGDYLDARLERSESRECAAHALRCLSCRALLDDVKLRLSASEAGGEFELDGALDQALEGIPIQHSTLSCEGFRDLITEFLDGYVAASTYHRFVEHDSICAECSALLPGVVYAVAACHSVHTFEEVEVPPSLTRHLLALPSSLDEVSLAMRGEIQMAELGHPLTSGGRRSFPRLVMLALAAGWLKRTAVAGAIASCFVFLIHGSFSRAALGDVFKKAQTNAETVYDRGAEIYSRKEEMVMSLQMVGSNLNHVWKTIEGDEPAPKDQSDGKANENSPTGREQ